MKRCLYVTAKDSSVKEKVLCPHIPIKTDLALTGSSFFKASLWPLTRMCALHLVQNLTQSGTPLGLKSISKIVIDWEHQST